MCMLSEFVLKAFRVVSITFNIAAAFLLVTFCSSSHRVPQKTWNSLFILLAVMTTLNYVSFTISKRYQKKQ